MNSALPFADSEPSVSPWKPWSAERTRARFVAARPSLSAASTASVPELVKSTRSSRAGVRCEQRLGEQAGQRGDAELHGAGRLELERLDQRGADARVVAADVVHPEAAEQVEVAVAVGVEEVRAVGARPGAVEADRAEHAHELRVDRPRPALVVVAAGGEQSLQVDRAHGRNVPPV